jgi:hypothetical protein
LSLIFPLDFSDISILLAFLAIISLAASELLLSYQGKRKVLINKDRLRSIGIAFSLLFLVTVGVRIVDSILNY